jgi:uncharacterized membrane protein
MEPKRIEALADGVLAIAMTLLVIELKVPAVPADGDLLHALLDHVGPHALWYAMSFVTLATFWIGHHTVFAHVRRVDRWFLWLNVLFLLPLAFLPFATALIGAHWREGIASLVYGGTLLLAGTALGAMWSYATRGRRLTDPRLGEEVVRGFRMRVAAGWVVYGAATAGALVSPAIAIVLFVLMPVAYVLPWGVDRHLRRAD